MCKIRHILSVIHYKIRRAVCFHFPCDDWENIYTLSYYHHQIGSMNYYPLFRVRSWNNGVCCMSFCILILILITSILSCQIYLLSYFVGISETVPIDYVKHLVQYITVERVSTWILMDLLHTHTHTYIYIYIYITHLIMEWVSICNIYSVFTAWWIVIHIWQHTTNHNRRA